MAAYTYSVLHPMKYVENDVMWYKACMTLSQGFSDCYKHDNWPNFDICVAVFMILDF